MLARLESDNEDIIYEGFHAKTRYMSFLKSWDKVQKQLIFFLFIFVFLEPLITSSIYIFSVSIKAKDVSGKNYCNLLFQLIK